MKRTESRRDVSVREKILTNICKIKPFLFGLLIIQSVLIVLSLFSLLYVDPGTASYTILKFDLFLLGISVASILAVVVWCGRRGY